MTPEWPGCRFLLAALGRIADIQLGKMLQPAPDSVVDEATPYLRAGSLSKLDSDDYPEMFASPLDMDRYGIIQGDLVVAEGGDVGRAEFVPAIPDGVIIQNSLQRLRPRAGDIRYIKYCLDAVHATGWLDVYCSKSTFGHLTREKLAALTVPYPSTAEQRAIADYLDAETARIDALIAAKIELLRIQEERRLAFIDSLFSTSPEAEPSRHVRWIRRVPKAWPMCPIGLVADVFNGSTPERDDTGTGDIPWTTSGEVDRRIVVNPTRYITESARKAQGLRIAPIGSVIVGLIGQGRTRGLSAELGISTTLNQNVAAVVPLDGRLDSRFLLLLLALAYDDLRNGGRGGNQAALNCEILKSYRVPLAPIESQRAIVRSAASDQSWRDRMAAHLRDSIDLLLERRQALITAAVTGQLEIPGVAA